MCPDFWHGESEKCLLAKKIYGNAASKVVDAVSMTGHQEGLV